MRCREIIPARKTQAVEFNEDGDIDTRENISAIRRWYHALITTLQDVDTLIYVHGPTIPKVAYPPGYWILARINDISPRLVKRSADADVAAVRQLLYEMGFQEPIFELNGHDPQSVKHLVNYLSELSQRRKGR